MLIPIDVSSSNVLENVHLSGTVYTSSPDDGIETVSGLKFYVRLHDV